jgi:transposase
MRQTRCPRTKPSPQPWANPNGPATTVSTLEAHRERIQAWVEQGVGGVAIHAALKREHGYSGSYSAVRRMLVDIRGSQPPEATCRLHFDPADAAQVDFGAGPMLQHPDGTTRRTWAFVMTLCFSRHQYVEFVWDQSWPPGWAATGVPSSGLAPCPLA